MQKNQSYDAFISYRHLPLDEAIAQRIQELLEQYRPPRSPKIPKGARIEKIFRDKTELPTCGDLSDSLQNALLSSRYLIVVLSPQTQESKWCMEEIRAFKEKNNGRIGHILPVLISGEPDECIPDILRRERRMTSDGQMVEVEVEPLCCDVRAADVKGSLKKLRTEFLRLAAPMLGCGFDDLYQRHLRRNNRLKAAAIAVLTAILAVISVFAYRSYVSEQRYERNLVDTYTRQGAQQLLDSREQEALMYYGHALALDPQDQAAKTGALLLLQQREWLRLKEQKEGYLIQSKPVYEQNRFARAMDKAGKRLLVSTRSSVHAEEISGGASQDLSRFGTFLSSAADGSCWTFLSDETITFFFTDDDSVWQVPRPQKINPCCAASLEYSFTEQSPSAMALSRERAAVRYGGYLYVYSFKEGGEAELFCEYDLADIFTESAETLSLELWNDMWTDDGGCLVVIEDNAHTAVINAAHAQFSLLNSVHIDYSCGLNDVVFSEDGKYYALVYSNGLGIDGFNAGGYFEVYDQLGKLMMRTEFDPGMAYSSAAFKPGTSRILAWGSSMLQVWDYVSGEQTASQLRLDRLASCAWGEGENILVDDGNGMLSTYEPVAFAPAAQPGEAAAAEKQDVYASEGALESGLVLKRTGTRIWLEDGKGNELDSADFGDQTDMVFIDRMYVDPANAAGYFWYDASDSLYRVRVDEKKQKIASAQKMDTRGWNIVDVQRSAGGAVAVTGNGYLLHYSGESVKPDKSLSLGRSGVVKETAADNSGLLAVILRFTEYAGRDSYRHENLYTMELWDMNMGVRLGNLEDRSKKLANARFTPDGWLIYERDGAEIRRMLDAPDPDEHTAAYLKSVSCYTLDDAQYVQTRTADFAMNIPDKWRPCLTAAAAGGAKQADAQHADPVQEELAEILAQQGADAWLKRYDEIWDEAISAGISPEETVKLFAAYVRTALDEGCGEKIRKGVAFASQAMGSHDPSAMNTHMLFDQELEALAVHTDAYDDLIIDYWVNQAVGLRAISDIETTEGTLCFISAYEKLLYAYLFSGAGLDSFILAAEEAYRDQVPLILEMSHADIMFDLAAGDPASAALAVNALLEECAMFEITPEDKLEAKRMLLFSMARSLQMLMRRGVMTQADISAMLENLNVSVGLRMTQLTHESVACGLQLGDIVIAVDGVRILNNDHLTQLFEENPQRQLTILRGGKTFETQRAEWILAGGYAVQ